MRLAWALPVIHGVLKKLKKGKGVRDEKKRQDQDKKGKRASQKK